VPVSAAISGLTEGTTYHFRVIAENGGGESKGADETFKTTSTPVKPTVKTEPASSVAQTAATLNGLVNPNGNEVKKCEFEYGTTTAYGSKATCVPAPGSGTANVPVAAAISGLTENTTYHFRVIAENGAGESKGADETFKTTKVGPPTCTKVVGEGFFGEGRELQRVRNNLSTNLAAKRQKFNFSWEHGRERFVGKEFEQATCSVRRTRTTFTGLVEGTLNGAPEFIARYTLRMSTEGVVTLIVSIRNENTRELIESFRVDELEGSTEEFLP
jgi:hypothetical protein